MTERELFSLIKKTVTEKCESNYLEIKAAKNGCPKLFDTLSAFSNQSGGGVILFGIDESEGYEICGVYDAADLEKKIMEQSLQMEPVVRPLCTVTNVDGKMIVSAEIQEIDDFSKPCFYRGKGRLKGSYVRTADGDMPMTEYEVYSYEAFKKKIQDELRIDERSEISDLYTAEFEKYLVNLKIKKPNLAGLPNEKICRFQGFEINGRPTLAGIMLFGDYPQAFYPQLCIIAVVIPGIEMSGVGSVGERFIDNMRIEGTIPQMIEGALAFVRRNMKAMTIIDKDTGKRADKTEYPVTAVREIIINSLVHRDYSIHTDSTPITIKLFTDRMEIENPGGLYGRMTLDRLGKAAADTRNPYIAGALEIMGETENRYSGIPAIINSMAEYGLPAPKFENDRGVFRVTLYNAVGSTPSGISDEEKEILEFCSVPRGRDELEKLFEGRISIAYLMTKYIRPMVKSNKLAMTIPDKPKSKKQKYYRVKGAI